MSDQQMRAALVRNIERHQLNIHPTPAQLAADRASAEQRGREHAAKIIADQAAHAQFWRDYEAGRVVLTVPGYEF